MTELTAFLPDRFAQLEVFLVVHELFRELDGITFIGHWFIGHWSGCLLGRVLGAGPLPGKESYEYGAAHYRQQGYGPAHHAITRSISGHEVLPGAATPGRRDIQLGVLIRE